MTTIKPPTTNPCGSCPYRTDVPSGIWHPDEYARLPQYDEPTPDQPTAMFLCHQANGHACAGWAGCHDMTHSLAVRLAFLSGDLSSGDFNALCEYTSPVELFPTGRAAADHGVAERPCPSWEAARAIDKIETRRNHRGEPTT